MALPPDAQASFIKTLAGIILAQAPFAHTPTDIMRVTAIVPGGVRARRIEDATDSGMTFSCLASYTPRSVGDTVLVLRLPTGPVIVDRLDTR